VLLPLLLLLLPLLLLLQAGVITDLVLLWTVGIRPVLVHGGGPEINSWLGKLGIQPEFKGGLRVTDGEVLCELVTLLHPLVLFQVLPGWVLQPRGVFVRWCLWAISGSACYGFIWQTMCSACAPALRPTAGWAS
jgi:hypothetical protein